MTVALLPPRAVPTARFAGSRGVVVLIATIYLVLTPLSFLNFGKLLPALVPLLVITIHLVLRARGRAPVTIVPLSLMLLVGWIATTNLWSADPSESLLDSVRLGVIVTLALLITSRCSFQDFLAGVALGGVVLLALSLLAAVVAPGVALESGYQAGGLRGVTLQRNALSAALIPPIIALFALGFRARRPRVGRLLSLVFLIGGVVATRSATGIAVVAAAIALVFVLHGIRRVRPRYRFLPAALGVATISAGAVVALQDAGSILQLAGRDSTLTGRTTIWNAVQALIDRQPLIGYGWGAAWGEASPVGREIVYAIGFEIPYAHSGYLDAILQIGFIGLAVLLSLVAVVAIRGIRLLFTSNSSVVVWAPTLVAALLIADVSETVTTRPPSLFLLCGTLVLLARANLRDPVVLEDPAPQLERRGQRRDSAAARREARRTLPSSASKRTGSTR